jgi:hypothetical protein
MLLEVYGMTTFLAACKLRWRSYSFTMRIDVVRASAERTLAYKWMHRPGNGIYKSNQTFENRNKRSRWNPECEAAVRELKAKISEEDREAAARKTKVTQNAKCKWADEYSTVTVNLVEIEFNDVWTFRS